MTATRPATRARLPLAAALLATTVLPLTAHASLELSDTAGILDGRPVLVADAERALNGGLSAQWRELYAVMVSGAKALCRRRAYDMIARNAESTVAAWQARVWQEAEVSDADAQRYASQRSGGVLPFGSVLESARHALRIERYRERLTSAADGVIGETFSFNLIAPGPAAQVEPRMPLMASSCLGSHITRDEIERFAAVPLYRVRADTVSAICSQIEGPGVARLAVVREARAAGIPVDELERAVAASEWTPTQSGVEARAIARYGVTTPEAMFKARVELQAEHRPVQQRRYEEIVKRLAQVKPGQCALELPSPPHVAVDRRSDAANAQPAAADAVQVFFFGAFRCADCRGGWKVLEQLRQSYGDRIALHVRHHFPEGSAALFADALAYECSAAQGRAAAAVAWLADDHDPAGLVQAGSLDADAYQACTRDPLTAVRVLEDTEEALRLGFVGAVPSWVVANKARRGAQGEIALRRTIDSRLRANAAASSSHARNDRLTAP